ncbi:hypothetical protein [uncultured Nitratireductor sp.]|uniref:hypothetical protein n=1 Tax=uncultured Nitratireductor sp. TaxID=520953 RepID=UPI0025DA7DFE|nr:hypothetical protein [uncultured Nitratireductor sp.]
MSDKIANYLKGSFSGDLTKLIENYEEFGGIDAFFNNAQTPKFFYEWAVQGMIYQLLVQLLGGRVDKYILLMEQPYTATNAELRTDIMYIDVENDLIHAIELKTDFQLASVVSDMRKMIAQITAGTIKTGIMVYLVEDDEQAGEWQEAFESDRNIKAAIHAKQIIPVDVLASRE